MINLDTIRAVAMQFPGVTEGTSFGTPGFHVRKKFLARMHQKEPALVLRMDMSTRDFLMTRKPKVYYITDHYRDWPAVLIRLATASKKELQEHFEEAWRAAAPKKLIADWERKK